MRKQKKRLVALCMAVLLSSSALPMQVFAAESMGSLQSMEKETTETTVQQPTVKQESTEAETEGTEAVETESTEVEFTETEAMDESDRMDSADELDAIALQKEEEKELEESTEIQEVQKGIIDYLTVDSPYIPAPDTQNIVVGVTGDASQIGDAVLKYKNLTTGVEEIVAASGVNQGAVLFSITYADENEKSVYQLQGMQYTCNGIVYEVDFLENGIDARYGVNLETETSPDAVMTNDEETVPENLQDAMNIVSVDENGNLISQETISEAIDSARADIAQNPEGDVNNEQRNAKQNVVVVLDPGHGGSDKGTTGFGLLEKDINLKIALACKAELEQYHGVTVYMTRTTDTYVNLDDRTTMAQNWGANVIVSIHINYSSSASASGAEIYYPNSHYNSAIGSQGSELASKIMNQLAALGLQNRGTKIRDCVDDVYPDGSKADYYSIIRNAKLKGFAGIIIEHAFISSKNDVNNFLTSDEKLKQMGIADAKGIAEYFGLSKQKELSIDSITPTAGKHDITIDVGYTTSADSVQFRYLYYDVVAGSWGVISEWTNSSKVKWKPPVGTYWIQVAAIDSNNIAKTATVGFTNTADYTKKYIDLSGICYQIKEHSVDVGVAYDTDDSNIKFRWQAYDLNAQQWSLIADWNGGNWATWTPKAGDYWLHVEAMTSDGTVADYTICFHADKNYTLDYVDLKGICYQYNAHSIDVGVAYDSGDPNVKFRWQAYNLDTGTWESVADWNGGNWATWHPKAGNYWLQAQAETSTGTSAAYTICFYADKNYAQDYVNITGVCVLQSTGKVDLGAAYESNDTNVAFMWQICDLSTGGWTTITDWSGTNWTTWKPETGSYWIYITAKTGKGSTASYCQGVTLNMGYPIMGTSGTSLQQMVNYYNSKALYPPYYALSDAPTITDFCRIYIEECTAEGVKPEVAFCQTMKETGFLKFGGDVSISQYNFAGLGAVGNGASGDSFATVREGVRAQVQHLKAYASAEPLVNPCVDKRYRYVSKGCAPYVEWLGISENPSGKGWATAKRYGYSIVNDYINKLMMY